MVTYGWRKKELFAYTLKSVKLRLKVLKFQLYCLPLYHKTTEICIKEYQLMHEKKAYPCKPCTTK